MNSGTGLLGLGPKTSDSEHRGQKPTVVLSWILVLSVFFDPPLKFLIPFLENDQMKDHTTTRDWGASRHQDPIEHPGNVNGALLCRRGGIVLKMAPTECGIFI